MSISKYSVSTFAGILAVLFWSSNIAVSRAVMNELGIYRAAFYIYFLSGVASILILVVALGKKTFLHHLRTLPLRYYLQTGIFFVFNNIFLFLAIGFAKSDEELLIVALLNYLWPVLIFIFRVPMYRLKVNWILFFISIAAACAGIVIALFQGYSASELNEISMALNNNFLAFIFAFLGAVSWALYSNLIRKYKSAEDITAIPLIFIFSGLVFLAIQLFRGEIYSLDFTPLQQNPYLVYTIIGPTCLGYLFWYLAMKHGNRSLVTSLSYLIPLISVYLVSRIHSIPVNPMFWISAVLIILGAILGMKAIKEKL